MRSAMSVTSVTRRVISCSASRLICRSRSARWSATLAIRFWVIMTKVEMKIASTDATIARMTKLGSNFGSGTHGRLTTIHAP